MVSLSEAHMRIPDRKGLYKALLRNQYIMPPMKDAINTVKFMRGVIDKKYWVLHSTESSTLKVCADPPNRKVLAKIVFDVLRNYRSVGEPLDSGMRRTAKWIKKTPPNAQWLLLILSTLTPNHELFSKGYIAPKKVVKQ